MGIALARVALSSIASQRNGAQAQISRILSKYASDHYSQSYQRYLENSDCRLVTAFKNCDPRVSRNETKATNDIRARRETQEIPMLVSTVNVVSPQLLKGKRP